MRSCDKSNGIARDVYAREKTPTYIGVSHPHAAKKNSIIWKARCRLQLIPCDIPFKPSINSELSSYDQMLDSTLPGVHVPTEAQRRNYIEKREKQALSI
jgi:hypothetical protein